MNDEAMGSGAEFSIEERPVTLTYHVDPDGNPVSLNVTVYNTFENVMDSDKDAPVTLNKPEDGSGL